MSEPNDTGPGVQATQAGPDLRERVNARTWFHTIDLGGGVVTPGQKDTAAEAVHFRLPDDLAGRSVLDIGAYDGFFSFEAERRGAERVVAADHVAWNWPGSDAGGNFELAREALGSKVESRDVAVEDLTVESVGGPFDVVLFLGVLYHAPDPLGYLHRVRAVTGGMAIVETVVDLLDVPVPAVAYYPGDSLNDDASNQFGPNLAAMERMLHDVGFSRVVTFDPWTLSRDWAIHSTGERGGLLTRARRRLHKPRSGRAVFHAYV
jgi:tRNA (mo5U34)-methyltransferase